MVFDSLDHARRPVAQLAFFPADATRRLENMRASAIRTATVRWPNLECAVVGGSLRIQSSSKLLLRVSRFVLLVQFLLSCRSLARGVIGADSYRVPRLAVDSSDFLARLVPELPDTPDHSVRLALL